MSISTIYSPSHPPAAVPQGIPHDRLETGVYYQLYYPATCRPKGHGSSSAAAEASAVLLLHMYNLIMSQTGIAGHSRAPPWRWGGIAADQGVEFGIVASL